jgi:hypothetical protein
MMADTENKRWRVEMADKTTRTVEAHGFRVEGGALVLVLPLGCAAAYAMQSSRMVARCGRHLSHQYHWIGRPEGQQQHHGRQNLLRRQQ